MMPATRPSPCHCSPQVLALELLKILLENSGPQFRTAERFVSAIKQYLCLSLLKNCQSAVPAALRLCCSIFLTLMTKFRKNLKAEIGGWRCSRGDGRAGACWMPCNLPWRCNNPCCHRKLPPAAGAGQLLSQCGPAPRALFLSWQACSSP